MRTIFPARLPAAAAFLLAAAALAQPAPAQESAPLAHSLPVRPAAAGVPADFTLEIPLPENRALPSWLGHPEVLAREAVSTLAIPVSPLAGPVPDLALTVVFLDLEGSFLRVIWDSPGGQATLSHNLGEGVGTLHQRTLIMSGERLRAGGELLISAPGGSVPVNAVRFEWLERRQVLATSETPAVALLDGARQLSPVSVSGLPEPPDGDVWAGWILSAPLIERIEPVEGGVAFAAQLEAVPAQALLTGKLAGIRPGTEARIFVNGSDAGPVPLQLPPLTDPGYGRDSSGQWYFAGWREFAAALPEKLLRAGENTFMIHWPETAQGAEPVSAGALALQLRFEPQDDNTAQDANNAAGARDSEAAEPPPAF